VLWFFYDQRLFLGPVSSRLAGLRLTASRLAGLRPAGFCRGLAFFFLIVGSWHCKGPAPRHQADVTYENGEEKSRTVTLPDGSKVEMTPHTVVRISKEFNKSERDLELDGEALFTVGSDGDKPFIVHTKNLHIQVQASGSRFKVEAFAKNAGEEADLLSGKLKVKKKLSFRYG